jgi:hypothetical protein
LSKKVSQIIISGSVCADATGGKGMTGWVCNCERVTLDLQLILCNCHTLPVTSFQLVFVPPFLSFDPLGYKIKKMIWLKGYFHLRI